VLLRCCCSAGAVPNLAVLLLPPPQGFASLKEKLNTGSTVWGAYHLPQNRDVCMVSSGDGSMQLYKYSYPDQRKVKVRRAWGWLGQGAE
jgi:hypothetical protein